MWMPFATKILDNGRIIIVYSVRLENGLTLQCVIEMPIWNEQTLSTTRRIGLLNTLSLELFCHNISSKSAKCHYPTAFTTHQLTGEVIAFPFLPNPNLKGNDIRDPDDSDHSEERDRPPAQCTRYAEYRRRLQTFTLWPHESPTPQTLSTAGFVYTGKGDLVRCCQCGLYRKAWCPDDDPLRYHAMHSPNCHFLRQLIGVDSLQDILCSSYYEKLYNHQQKKKGRNTQYQTMEARVNSFNGFDSRAHATIQEFANAGLYYTGFNDNVRCFECHGGLRDCDADDDPWFEHCRWFPNCPYAIEIKGREYIARVQEDVNTHDEENIPQQLTCPDTETQAMLSVYKTICLGMGYDESDIRSTVEELRNRGVAEPSLQDILDLIEIINVDRQQPTPQLENETPMDQNRRLKSFLICMKCQKNETNALFIPCAHHKLCMSCAQPLESCSECGIKIQQKIRTFRA